MMTPDTLAIPLPGLSQPKVATSEPHAVAAGSRAIPAETTVTKASTPTGGSVFLPLSLLALAVVAWFGFESVQLALEYRQIRMARAGLAAPTQGATQVRASLDAVASATARLANDGNPNARSVVEELRRRGVTIDPEKALQK